MRQKSFILVLALLILLIGGAVSVYAYDSGRKDRIAEGITVAGADVGGMSTAEARRTVRRRVAALLHEPVVVTYHRHSFVLTPRAAGVHADVGAMIDEALQDTRDGTIFSRVWRDVTGGEEHASIPILLTHASGPVMRLVRRVRRTIDRPAHDARLDFPSLSQLRERIGVRVEAPLLRARVDRALTVPGASRRVDVPSTILHPKVTRRQLAARYPHLIVVMRGAFQLRYYEHLRLWKTYTIAVGQIGLETPAGLYHVQNKAVNPAWNVPTSAWAGSLAGHVIPGGAPNNPLKARWLGIAAGAGIHGTDQLGSLGTAASHGCIRMSIPDVIELYSRVPVGSPVYIA